MRDLLFIAQFDLLTVTEKLLWSLTIIATLLLVILLMMDFLKFDLYGEPQKATKKKWWLDDKTVLLFLTFFGWASILAHLWEPSVPRFLFYGFLVGAFAAVAPHLLGRIKPRKSANNKKQYFDLQEALKSTGEVLQYIPPHHHGTGKVYLNLRKVPYPVDAVSSAGELPVGVPVRVIKIIDAHTIEVEPLDGRPPHQAPVGDQPPLTR